MRKVNPKKRSISTPLVLTVLKSKQVMFPSTQSCNKYHLFRDLPVANSISDWK